MIYLYRSQEERTPKGREKIFEKYFKNPLTNAKRYAIMVVPKASKREFEGACGAVLKCRCSLKTE